MKTTMSLKIDDDVKQKAAAVAHDLGFSLSAIINANLKQLIATREVHVSLAPKMTPYLESVIAEAEADYKAGHVKTFDTVDELFADFEKNENNAR